MESISLPPYLSQRLAEQAARLDPAQPTQDVAFPQELLALGERILEQIDRTGLSIVYDLVGDLDAVLFALMRLVGQPIQDEKAGPMIMDLKPVRHEMSVETTSYYSWNEFDYHTDLSYVDEPPDFIAVLCVQPDPNGEGESIFSDVRVSAPALSPEAISALQEPHFTFRAPPHYKGGRVVQLPILERTPAGELTLRVRFDRLEAEGVEAQAALQELYHTLDQNKVEILLPHHSAYIVDNRRVVHGRSPFTPTFDERDRHLKRILGMRR
ncbi:MAG: TauD/TfdA family dioxygenase [Ardenticatenales bacterium]|nr:TauD/TfdA family dioxygenase [Ardenticatenales bacterium]